MDITTFKDVPMLGYFGFAAGVFIRVSPTKIRAFNGGEDIAFKRRSQAVTYYGQNKSDVLAHIKADSIMLG